ncbi:hypothetical protein KA005_19790, partial [bacterium]|nr:hypothetical protein [bacterium]
YLEESFEPWKVYWHGLTSSLDMPTLKDLGEKMAMVDSDCRRMVSQRKKLNGLLDSLYQFDGDNYHLYTLLIPYDTESLLFIMAKANSEKIRRLISTYFSKLKGTKNKLSGKDLALMGLQPGPIFKEVFDHLLEARLNNLIKTKEDEIRFIKETFGDRLQTID